MAAFGAPEAIIARCRDAAPEPFGVWPENWDATRLFVVCATQWRRAGMAGVPVGLDYAGVLAAARLMDSDTTAELFDQIRAMEAAALDVMLDRWERTS